MRTAVLATVFGLVTCMGAFADWDSNPGFETPYTNGWFSFTPDYTTNSTDFAFEGNMSLKIETPDIAEDPVPGGNLPVYTIVDSPFNAAIADIEYTVTVQYYVDSALKDHERMGVGLFWLKLNDAGDALEYSEIDIGGWTTVFGPETAMGFPTGEETVGAWTTIQHTGVAPADAQFIQIALEAAGDGSSIYFDGVTVIPEPASILLIGLGLATIGMARRKQHHTN